MTSLYMVIFFVIFSEIVDALKSLQRRIRELEVEKRIVVEKLNKLQFLSRNQHASSNEENKKKSSLIQGKKILCCNSLVALWF